VSKLEEKLVRQRVNNLYNFLEMYSKRIQKSKIKSRIRRKISGTSDLPRLSVFRSNKNIYAQCIDDLNGLTLASVSSKQIKATGSKTEVAKEVGKALAEKAKSAGISTIVFDRGGNLYHGRVKALAEGAREGGLTF
jgi:large subunit ribosomal protein L18